MFYNNRLKLLRERNGETQKQLASILNIGRTAYVHYENEDVIIPIKHLNILSNYYNVSLDYLFEFSNTKNYKNSKENIDLKLSSIRLKEFRKTNNLTKEKLANILNVLHQTISAYEKGKNIIATPFLYDICKKYHISADYLLGKTDNPQYYK